MDRRKAAVQGSKEVAKREKPHSLAIAGKGIVTGHDFAAFMSSLMSDLIAGRVSPNIGNAACNAGGKLLKVVEMQLRFGTQSATNEGKVLFLTASSPLTQEVKRSVAAD